MTKEQIKAINDAMSFLLNADNLYKEYGAGCIETEAKIHEELMEEAGVDDDIIYHFDMILCLAFSD